MKTRLSVNINKVALIRNARGSDLPDLIKFAQDCEAYGAEGITVHPRPDERHIRYDDLPALKYVVTTEFNIEGYPSEKFIKEVLAVSPHQCTLVPDPPGVLTSDKGWEIDKEADLLTNIIQILREHGIRSSLFIDPEPRHVAAAATIKADCIELYTGEYARDYQMDKESAVARHILCSQEAQRLGIRVNAGHDLNLENLAYYAQALPELSEVSIGHALISDALYYGIANTIGMYRALLS